MQMQFTFHGALSGAQIKRKAKAFAELCGSYPKVYVNGWLDDAHGKSVRVNGAEVVGTSRTWVLMCVNNEAIFAFNPTTLTDGFIFFIEQEKRSKTT